MRGSPISPSCRWRAPSPSPAKQTSALFQMTPYYWKTPKTGAKRLADLESLTTRISFRIHMFRKL